MIRLLLNLILLASVGFLGYQLYNTIEEPITFNTLSEKRKDAAVEKLKTIRQAEIAFRNANGRYVGTTDSLINFIKNDKYTILTKIGDPNDTTVATRIDTSYVALIDSLLEGNKASADSLLSVPYTDGKKFELIAGHIVKNETSIPAFEAKVKYGDLYGGLVEKYYAPKKENYLQVGSMQDATTTGNWEK